MSKVPNKSISKRKVYLDALRIIAIFLVIFNHSKGYRLYQTSDGIIQTCLYMFITMFTRINAPLFIMITGSLMLNKKESMHQLYKRILRYIIIIIIFNTILYFIENVNISLIDWVIKILSGDVEWSYWFLYEYLGTLIMLPFLKPIISVFDRYKFSYFLFFHFITVSLIPIIKYIVLTNYGINLSVYIDLPLMQEKFIFFLFVGYYIDNILDINSINKGTLILLSVCSISGILISCGLTYHQGVNSQFTQDFVQLFDYIVAMTVFLFVKYIFIKKNHIKEKYEIYISRIAILVFGIYLFEPILRSLLYNKIETMLLPLVPMILISFVWCVISMIICGMIVYILKKIPIIKKLL